MVAARFTIGRLPPFRLIAMLLAWTIVFASRLEAELTVPQTGDYVVDQAGVIDPQVKAAIEDWLGELEQKTTAQVKVLTVQSTDGEDIFQFTQRHYDRWKLGKKGKDNGALVVLDVKDHKVRIHTGYGLEGVLPDSWCGSLSRSIAQEYFKRGAYGSGLQQMAIVIANRIADEAGVKLSTPQHRFQGDSSNSLSTWVMLIIIVVLLLLYWIQRRRRPGRYGTMGRSSNRGGPWYGGGMGGGSWGGGSWGGGYSGGGSFGGGSWGGGGMSGGGGGGASW